MNSERLMVAIDNLIKARLELESQKHQDPSYIMQIEGAEDRVRTAQIKLTTILDNIKFK